MIEYKFVSNNLPMGWPSQVLAHPSKQHRPLPGQSVSLWPGDQQVDTDPSI